MATSTSVFLIQDKAVVRAGLAALINKQSGLKLVGQSGAKGDALHLVRQSQPDVIIVDLRLALSADELDAPRELRSISPNSRVVLLIDSEESEVFAMLAAEADGYCLRESDFERLHNVIVKVAAGDFWLDSVIARKVVKALLDTMAILSNEPSDGKNGTEIEDLSPREVEVLSLVSRGLSNQKIAENLGISAETVKSHIRHIMKKLVVNDRTQAAVKALKRGLI
jgi:DNA-binding NarL/FixJ family response regulator